MQKIEKKNAERDKIYENPDILHINRGVLEYLLHFKTFSKYGTGT